MQQNIFLKTIIFWFLQNIIPVVVYFLNIYMRLSGYDLNTLRVPKVVLGEWR